MTDSRDKLANIDDFWKWFTLGKFIRSEISYPFDPPFIPNPCYTVQVNKDVIHVEFFTEVNKYRINIRVPTGKDMGYLGCTSSARKSRAGENYTRGNDLADGPFTEGTWIKIMSDILSYEMVNIRRTKASQPNEENVVGVVGPDKGCDLKLQVENTNGEHSEQG